MRVALATVVWLVWQSIGSAGVIHWSFASSSMEADGYSITGNSGTIESVNGIAVPITVMLDFQSPAFVAPFPVEGPVLHSNLTITDTTSGTPGTWMVPTRFFDNEPAPEGEIDWHIARYGQFDPVSLDLGDHRYTVSTDTENIYVQVSPIAQAPEPSTLLISAIGLAWIPVRSWRRSASVSRLS